MKIDYQNGGILGKKLFLGDITTYSGANKKNSGIWKENAVPSVEYITSVDNGTAGAIQTFNSTNIGGPGLIVVGINADISTNASLSSCTIGGTTANNTTTTSYGNGTYFYVFSGFCYLVVTSGTTSNIVVTFSASVARCRIATWRIRGCNSITPIYEVKNQQSGTGLSSTLPNLKNNSIILSNYTLGTNGIRVTWAGSPNYPITEVYDSDVASSTTGAASAYCVFTGNDNKQNAPITTSHSATSAANSLICAAWR